MFIIQQCNKSYLLDCKLSLTFSSCRFSEGSARVRCEVIFLSLKLRLKFFETVLSWWRGWDKSRYRHHSFARALRALVSRAPDRTAMLRRLGVCRGGMVTGQIEPCITHIDHSDRIIANAIVSWDENFYINSLWKGIYSANLVFIWYNQIYRKEGTINLSNSHLTADMKNTVEFLTAQRTRIEVQDPYLGTGKFPDSDNP